ncbi:MAG: UDP-N-acetylmuramate dehydrogenase [Anaerolineae bacterium]
MSEIQRLREKLTSMGYGERLLADEPMAHHTSLGIGGPADLLVIAKTLDELVALQGAAHDCGIPVHFLGSGTNVLVADAGMRGLVVINACHAYGVQEGDLLVAESGTLLQELARWAVANGWAGLEWAVGVPGTLGGAVVGNAGAYGGCMADCVTWVRLLRMDGSQETLPAERLEFAYRTSVLKRLQAGGGQRPWVLEAALRLTPGDAVDLADKANKFREQRQMHTPAGRCAGSTFKRTLQYPAGFLIEQAGLKGRRIGGAEVSCKHANFLMNVGGATAADMRALIELVQSEVRAAFGQRLEPEIEFLGEWS